MTEHCARCNKGLPESDPLTHTTPGKNRRYNPDHPPRSPVRVLKKGPDGEPQILYWCSSRHYKMDHENPSKPAKKGRLKPDQYFHIRPRAA